MCAQEVKALIQLRDLNSKKLDEMRQGAFLKQREASTLAKELVQFQQEMASSKQKVYLCT